MGEYVDRFWTAPDGLKLYARDYPAAGGGAKKLPVLCLHGLTRNSRDFEGAAPRIAAMGRRVLAVDVRGRGRSAYDPDPSHYTLPVYAADLLALVERTGIERAVFVATSMGGLITLTLAAVAPKLVAATLLNDVGPEVAPEGIARILSYAGGTVGERSWDEAVAYTKATNGVAFPHNTGADWDAFARRLFRETATGRFVLDYDPEIMATLRSPPTAPPPDLWPLFADLARDRPLALVRGALSDVLTASIAARMRDAAPHMTVAEVAGVGHAPMLTEPEAVAALDRLLAEAD